MEYSSEQYLLEDHSRSLFPLNTTRILVKHHGDSILKYIYEKVLNPSQESHSFLNQLRCYSSKRGLHLRRTVRLDPVAEMFIYDLIYRSRNSFRNDFSEDRKSFGYRFQYGRPVPITQSYTKFKSHIAEARDIYEYSAKFDISTYFNSLYHHDIVSWFSGYSENTDDVAHLGQFLREANAGRTVDCLPHGIHPCKMIGAEFMKFIDNSISIRCSLTLRFMDDIYIFDNDIAKLRLDFINIQRMLGEKGLSVNSSKTTIGTVDQLGISKEIDAIKSSLLMFRRRIIEVSGVGVEDIEEVYGALDPEQIEYLLNLLKNPNIDESDAELVLVLLRDYGDDVIQRMYDFLLRFPSLSKKIYMFCRYVEDKNEVARLMLKFLKSSGRGTEDQLFWIAKIAEDYLQEVKEYPDILHKLYSHVHATPLTRAKVLEITENRFGFPELRSEHLRIGKSDWLSWSAAVGCMTETKIKRNHLLGYFAKGSAMNKLVADCITKI